MNKALKVISLFSIILILGMAWKIAYVGIQNAYNHVPFAAGFLSVDVAAPDDQGEWTDDSWDTYFQPTTTSGTTPPAAPTTSNPPPPVSSTPPSKPQTPPSSRSNLPASPTGSAPSSTSVSFPKGSALSVISVTVLDKDDNKPLPAHVFLKSSQGTVLGEGDADAITGRAKINVLTKETKNVTVAEAVVGRRHIEVPYTQNLKILLPKAEIELKGQVFDPQDESSIHIEEIKNQTFLKYIVESIKGLFNIKK